MELSLTTKQKQLDKVAMLVPLVLALYIAATNLEGLFALPYVAFCLICCIVRPVRFGMGVLVVNMVYLGYSYIDFYATVRISAYGFTHLCALFVGMRGVYDTLRQRRLSFDLRKLGVTALLLALMIYVTVCQGRISDTEMIYSAALMLALWHVIKELHAPGGGRVIAGQLTGVVLTVFLYYVLQRDAYKTLDAGRFPGVRDANNFALHCNLSLVLLNAFFRDLPRRWRLPLNLMLIVGVAITVSFSGIVTMAAIGLTVPPKRGRVSLFLLAAVGLVLGTLLLLYLAVPEFLASMGGVFNRVVKVLDAWWEADYNTMTTGRSELWEYYLEKYQQMPVSEQLWGNQTVIADLLERGAYSSHNTYIDYLLNYGSVGLGLLIGVIISRVVGHIRRKETIWMLVCLIVAVNMFFRTFSGMTMYLFLLL